MDVAVDYMTSVTGESLHPDLVNFDILAKKNYRVFQNYPNMQFFAIFATALKPLMLRLPKFAEILIKSQS